jgi:putative hydrolase of the HAD superfamily
VAGHEEAREEKSPPRPEKGIGEMMKRKKTTLSPVRVKAGRSAGVPRAATGAGSGPIRAVFFDAGGTLFRAHPSVGHVYAGLAKKYGCTVPADWVEERFHKEFARRNGMALLRNLSENAEREFWSTLVGSIFGGKIGPDVFDAFFDELYDLFAQPQTWRLFPDALKTLRTLRDRGLRVGIVSNWDSRLFRLCDGLGVSEHVEFILASAVVGHAKPQRGIFERALLLAGVKPYEALHVGDSYREDYWGARQAGLKSVLICHRGPARKDADSVPSLSAVCAIVKS